MKKILSIATTSQNLLKISSLDEALVKLAPKVKHSICHIVQNVPGPDLKHLSGIKLPNVDYTLSVDLSDKILRTANTMIEFEKIIRKEQPSLVVLTGSQDMTLACALTAAKLKVPVAHTDSGLRSFDRESNDEVNRILTDVLCQYHFVSEHSGMKNLRDEGEDNQNIIFSGNLLADFLNKYWKKIESGNPARIAGLKKGEDYILYVPAKDISEENTDLTKELFDVLGRLTGYCKVFAILSENAKQILKENKVTDKISNKIEILSPVSYLDFLVLMYSSRVVVTNSVSIQEETTYLGVQCVTVMNYTERPVTIDVGTNHLAGVDPEKAERIITDILEGTLKPGRLPENWDGNSGKRIVEELMK